MKRPIAPSRPTEAPVNSAQPRPSAENSPRRETSPRRGARTSSGASTPSAPRFSSFTSETSATVGTVIQTRSGTAPEQGERGLRIRAQRPGAPSGSVYETGHQDGGAGGDLQARGVQSGASAGLASGVGRGL